VELTQEFHDERQLGALADPQTHLTGELQFQCRLRVWCRDFDKSGWRRPSVLVVGRLGTAATPTGEGLVLHTDQRGKG
jgi:hypothetical protein